MEDAEVALRLGRAVRAAREERGLTRRVLAARAEVHPNWVAIIERGEKNTSVPTLLGLAAALGVSPGALLDEVVGNPPATSARRPASSEKDELDLVLGRTDRDGRELVRQVLLTVARRIGRKEAKAQGRRSKTGRRGSDST